MTSLTVSNAGSFPNFNLSSLLTQPTDESVDKTSSVALAPIDELLLSSVEEDPSFASTRSETRLQTRTQLRIDDESIRIKTRTHLRYRYDFEAADGTRIQIKARANLSYSAELDEDGDVSIKVRAKFQVSLLQESVNSDVDSFSSLGGSEELISTLSDALAAFNNNVSQTTSDFLNGENLNGDGLIIDLVNAFNGLADAIDSTQPISFPNPELSTAIEPPADEAALAELSTSPERLVIPDALPPTDVLLETPAEIQLVDNPPLAETFEIDLPIADEPDSEVDETSTDEPAEHAETEEFQSLRLNLRFQFTESLYQLLDVFNGSDDQPSTVTRLNYKSSAKLNFSARFYAADGGEPEVPAFDASA